jgi:hypothetical protein
MEKWVRKAPEKGGAGMIALLVLLLIAILFGIGFAVKALLWVALALLAIWLIGFAFRPTGGRWYYW